MTAEEWASRAVGNVIAGVMLLSLGFILDARRLLLWTLIVLVLGVGFFAAALFALIKWDDALEEERR